MGRGSGRQSGESGGNGDLLLIDFAIFGGIASLLLFIYMYLFVKKYCCNNNSRTKLTISDVKSYGSTDHHSYDNHEDHYEDHPEEDHYSDHGGEDVQNSRMYPIKHWVKVWSLLTAIEITN